MTFMRRLLARCRAYYRDRPLAYALTATLTIAVIDAMLWWEYRIPIHFAHVVILVVLAFGIWARAWSDLKRREGSKNIFAADVFDLIDRKPRQR